MIQIEYGSKCSNQIVFTYQDKLCETAISANSQNQLDTKMLSSYQVFNETNNTLHVLIGLGKYSEFARKKIKSVLAKSIKKMKQLAIEEFSVNVSLFMERYGVQCLWDVIEGIKLGLYQFKAYKKEENDYTYRILLHGIDREKIEYAEKIINEAENLMDGVILARDMVNTPSNKLTPSTMAEKISSLGEQTGFTVDIIHEPQLKQLGMHAFLTVGTSSGNPPNLIVMRYQGNQQSNQVTALVGKGVTCDTGGYCLKSSSSMTGIKGDMAGGAAVTGAIYALAKNKVKTNVVGIIPACENRISRESFVPGDVIDSMSGKTIEIRNTDAEGRLILADAITYAIRNEKVNRIIDVATLTGKVVTALGFTTGGLLTNNQDFYSSFQAAYETSGEQYWQLPSYEEYRELLKSDIADIKNIGEDYCQTITAGLFIEAFVEQLPWIHLDIAGTAWVDKPIFEYQSVGATGASVTSMYFLMEKECDKL